LPGKSLSGRRTRPPPVPMVRNGSHPDTHNYRIRNLTVARDVYTAQLDFTLGEPQTRHGGPAARPQAM
jgi:hypothetical protein